MTLSDDRIAQMTAEARAWERRWQSLGVAFYVEPDRAVPRIVPMPNLLDPVRHPFRPCP